MIRKSLGLLALLCAVILAGCNGGSQSSVSSAGFSPSSSSVPVPVSGRASKGILQQATVVISVVENGMTREIGRVTTDDQGNFSYDFAGVQSPVLLQVIPQGNGDSHMICDASGGCGSVPFGSPMPLPADFKLTALYTPDELKSGLPVTVTPLTHLAAQWALQMPGGVTDQAITLARQRVAALMGLASDFAFQHIPDVTNSSEMASAADSARRYAVLGAAFEQMAQKSGKSLKTIFDTYLQALADHAGELPEQGDGSLAALFNAASSLVGGLPQGIDVQGLADSFSKLLANLGSGVSNVPSPAPFDQASFDAAMAPLNTLDGYLHTAGIDASGNFLKNQAPQVNWLYTQDMLGLVQVSARTALATAVASVIGGVLKQSSLPMSTFPPMDLSSLVTSGGLTATYAPAAGTLTVTGTDSGQTVNVTIQVAPLTAGTQTNLNYGVSGSIGNATATGQLDGSLNLDFYGTALSPVISSISSALLGGNTGSIDTQQLLQGIANLMSSLHVRASVNGSGSLVSATDGKTFSGDIDAWGELNLPAVQNGGTIVAAQINSGHLTSPNGDTIFSLPGASASTPALSLQVGDGAHLSTQFGTHAFGLPEIDFSASGDLAGLRDFIAQAAGQLQQLDPSNLDLSALTSLVQSLNFSLLDLSGTGSISVPANNQEYRFTLDGNRLDVSADNSTETVLSVYLTALNGGYLYAGGMLVGTFHIDLSNLSVTMNLVDGTSRTYALGPITDIVDPSVIQALLGLIPAGP